MLPASQKVSDSPRLLQPRNHADAGRHRLQGLSEGDQCWCAEVRHVLALDVHHLVAGLQTSEVGAAALHHGQDVARPGAPKPEAKRLWPVLVGGWEAEIWGGQKRKLGQ